MGRALFINNIAFHCKSFSFKNFLRAGRNFSYNHNLKIPYDIHDFFWWLLIRLFFFKYWGKYSKIKFVNIINLVTTFFFLNQSLKMKIKMTFEFLKLVTLALCISLSVEINTPCAPLQSSGPWLYNYENKMDNPECRIIGQEFLASNKRNVLVNLNVWKWRQLLMQEWRKPLKNYLCIQNTQQKSIKNKNVWLEHFPLISYQWKKLQRGERIELEKLIARI